MTRVVFVVGPTASGKSALALDLAAEFGGHILNCDSLQACQRLDVGSAKPTSAERARVPHHLFDVVAPGERFTAGDFRKLALEAIEKIDGLVFAVGGSGFYIQALERGMFDVPKPKPETERRVRERLAAEGAGALHAELSRRDPECAEALGPNDTYRVARALMMMDDSGRTATELRRSFRAAEFPWPKLKLGLAPARDVLARRVEVRTAAMLGHGLVDETRALLDEGHRQWPALASVGYAECVRHLEGELEAEDLPARITQKTMALAKKQRTWFNRDSEIRWLREEDPLAEARELVRRFIDPSAGAS